MFAGSAVFYYNAKSASLVVFVGNKVQLPMCRLIACPRIHQYDKSLNLVKADSHTVLSDLSPPANMSGTTGLLLYIDIPSCFDDGCKNTTLLLHLLM